MGGVWSMYGEEGHTGFWWGNLRERDHWEDLGVDRKIISKLIKALDGVVNWIDPAQDREMWWALVNTVMNFRITWNMGNFLTGWGHVSFQKGLCSTELFSMASNRNFETGRYKMGLRESGEAAHVMRKRMNYTQTYHWNMKRHRDRQTHHWTINGEKAGYKNVISNTNIIESL